MHKDDGKMQDDSFPYFLSFLLLTFFLFVVVVVVVSEYQESLYLYLATRLDMPDLVHFLEAS